MAGVRIALLLLLSRASPEFYSVMAVSQDAGAGDHPTACADCLWDCTGDMRCTRCGLTSIPPDLDCDLVMTFDLTGNNIRELQAGAFSGIGGMSYLVLTDNKIADVPPGVFEDLGRVRALYIDGNNLTGLPEGAFRGLGGLDDRLMLMGNQLKRVTTGVFGTLTLAKILALDNNRIRSIQPGAFRGMANLRGLYLQRNRISLLEDETFSGLERLETLDLSHNRIETLEGAAFGGLTSLRQLLLSANRIASLAAITGLPRLNLLALAHNEVETLGDNSFLLGKLQEEGFDVDLRDNPLRCSCSVESLRLWYRKRATPTPNADAARCATPTPNADAARCATPTPNADAARCASPGGYAGGALVDIQAPLPCPPPRAGGTSVPLTDTGAGPLLSHTMYVVVTIVAVGVFGLVTGTYLVLRRHKRKMRAQRGAGPGRQQQEEAAPPAEPTPVDPSLEARGYSTFVERDQDAARDLPGTGAPCTEGHVFRDTEEEEEEEETLPCLPHGYLPAEELNLPGARSSTAAPLPLRAPSWGPVMRSPVVACPADAPFFRPLEPDISCRVDFDEQGRATISSFLDLEPGEGDLTRPLDREEVRYAELDHSVSNLPWSGPRSGAYIAPRDLVQGFSV